jgi:hypothetical protein
VLPSATDLSSAAEAANMADLKPEEPNLILSIRAADPLAAEALCSPHNEDRFVNSSGEEFDIPSREPTPFSTPFSSQELEDSYPRLRLTFDRRPKNIAKGFVFGSDSKRCDVLLGNKRNGISGEHFYITFDTQGRLMLIDTSSGGTAVSYNGQAADQRRKNFRWILFPNWEIKVRVKRKAFIFELELASHETCKPIYDDNIRAYLQESQSALPEVSMLDFRCQESTAAPTEVMTPYQHPIYLLGRKIGSGGFGSVYKATNVSKGTVLAAKKFNAGSSFDVEVGIMKTVLHVRC